MVICPACKEQVPHSATTCPRCGERIIPGDQLQSVPTRTTSWQVFVIIVSIILLIAIGITFYSAENRENQAAQANFSAPVMQIVGNVAAATGMGAYYGQPAFQLKAETKQARVSIVFPTGPLSQEQAQTFANAVCGELAHEYVLKGYMPRHIMVAIGTALANGRVHYYGQSIYNGDIDSLGWEAAR